MISILLNYWACNCLACAIWSSQKEEISADLHKYAFEKPDLVVCITLFIVIVISNFYDTSLEEPKLK